MSEIRPVTRRSRRTKLKFFGVLAGVLLVTYFVVTSGPFLKAVVLPIASGKLNADLTVGDISLSPFSSLEIRQLVLRPKGAEPLVSIGMARVRYGLFAILAGDIRLDEVTVESPELDLVNHPDGTSNLSRWLASLPKSPEKPEGVTSPTPHVHVANVKLQGGRVRISGAGGASTNQVLEVSGITLGLDRLENGGAGKLTLSAQGSDSRGPAGQLQFKTSGALDLALDAELMPTVLSGTISSAVNSATGSFRDLADASLALDLDVKAPDIRQVRLAVRKGTTDLAQLSLSGPYDAARHEARIGYELKGVDRRMLGLVGALAGMDFGGSALAASGRVDLTQGGVVLTVSSRVTAREVAVRIPAAAGTGAKDRTTPTLEGDLDFQTTLNLKESTALVDRANISMRQAGVRVLEGTLDRPMNLSWGGNRQGFREATYSLTVAGLELEPWKAFFGGNAVLGTVEAGLNFTAKDDGRQLSMQGTIGMKDAQVTGTSAGLDHLTVKGRLSGNVERFRVVDVDTLVIEIRRNTAPLLRLSASGRTDPDTQHTAAQLSTEIELPLILALAPIPGASIKTGTVKASAQYRVQPESTLLTAELGVMGVNGSLGSSPLVDYQARWDGTVELGQDVIRVKRSALNLQAGFKPGGPVEIEGEIEARLPWQHPEGFALHRGKFQARLSKINEAGLNPWMTPALAPNKLVSVDIDGTASVQFDLEKLSKVQSAVKVSNFRVSDTQFPEGRKPIQLGLNVDASGTGTQVDVQRILLQFGPTTNAVNELLVAGKLDLTGPTPATHTGAFTVSSDGLDFTPLASAFGVGGSAEPKTKATPATEPPAAGPQVEPAPMVLPFSRFDTDVKIARVFLRDLVVSNFIAKIGIQQGKVTADPFALSINGAPVTARAAVDLGVPGFNYDLSFSATKLPVTPVASSVLSGDWVALHGEVSAGLKVAGAGVTGPNLRKHLAAEVSLDAKGLDYQITALKTPLLRTLTSVLSTVLRLPNIAQSPIDSISMQTTVTNGLVQIASAKVASPAFLAETHGTVTLADVLPNSTLNLPVSVSVPKAGQYDRLPDFLTIKGTLAKPEPSYDPLAIPGILTRLPAGLGSAVGSGLNRLGDSVNKATGGAASAVGAFLGTANSNAGANTNGAAKSGGGLGGLINSLGNAIGGQKPTNAASSTATNAPSPSGLLDLFPKSKK